MSGIEPGVVVQLKSGGREMTCEEAKNGGYVCCWFDEEWSVHRGNPEPQTLERVPLKEKNVNESETDAGIRPGVVVELKSAGGPQMTCESRPQVQGEPPLQNYSVPGDDVCCCWFDRRGNLHSGESFKVAALRVVEKLSA